MPRYSFAVGACVSLNVVFPHSIHNVRKIVLATATVTTLAGGAHVRGYLDGTGTAARFNAPRDITMDTNTGLLFVADVSWSGVVISFTDVGAAIHCGCWLMSTD